MLVRWLPWLPEPGAWAGDISRLNSEGCRSPGFLSEMGSVPASDTEPAADTEPASPSQPSPVVSVGYNANNTDTTQKYFQCTKNILTNVSKRRTLCCWQSISFISPLIGNFLKLELFECECVGGELIDRGDSVSSNWKLEIRYFGPKNVGHFIDMC